MSSKYGFFCFVALGLVLLLIFKNYEIWTQPIEWIPKESTARRPQSKPENKPEVSSTLGTQTNPTSIKSYISISEKNLFSPDRKDFLIPVGNGKRQLVRPQVILYGVTIAGDYQAASVANPGRPLQKGERETYTVRKGERISEYKLVGISSDRVTLEAEGDSFEVFLYDQSKSKQRTSVRTETKPATITSTSTQAVPSASVPGASVPTPPTPSTAVPIITPPAGSGREGVATPTLPSPVSPTLPGSDVPRRRTFPPSGTSQNMEGN